MVDDPEVTDQQLANMVAAKDFALGQQVRARLRALRLRCIVTPEPARPVPEPAPVPSSVPLAERY